MASPVRPLGLFARPLLLLFVLGFTALDVSAQSHFTCHQGTGNIYNGTVIVTTDGTPELDGVSLQAGSEIAVFSSDSAYSDICVGMLTWQETAGSITVWGDDNVTAERDGLESGDELRFRLWDSASGTEHVVEPENITYLKGSGVYEHDATFVLSRISAVTQSVGLLAVNDAASTDEDAEITINVLANDDGGSSSIDPASVDIIRPPVHGKITSIDPATGSITYLSNKDYAGSDFFKYVVYDITGVESKSARVGITVRNVNDPPRATNDAVAFDEDSQIEIDILGNDSDVDGAELDYGSVTISSPPTNGIILDIDPATGKVVYEPTENFSGQDSFEYTVRDVHGAISDTARVALVVQSINDAPVATADEAIGAEDEDLTIDILPNDTDVDGDALDASSVRIRLFPVNGRVTHISETTGIVTFTPDPNFTGTDTFSYTVADEHGLISNEILVQISITQVNDPPVFMGHPIVNTAINYVYDYTVRFKDVDGDILSISASIIPTWLKLTDNGDGTASLKGTPSASDSGSSNVELVAEDPNGGTGAYAYTIVVGNNAAPIASDDVVTTPEDQHILVDILANDFDPEGDAFDISSISIEEVPRNGTIGYIHVDTGEVTYIPDQDFNGFDQFEYSVSDVTGSGSNIVEVTVTVTPMNDAPVALDEIATTSEDVSVVVHVLENDTDIENDEIHVSSVGQPGYGSVTISTDASAISYFPDADFNGTDTFSYTTSDTGGLSSTAYVTVVVDPVDDAPYILNIPNRLLSPGSEYQQAVEYGDVDGDNVTLSILSGPSWLSVMSEPNGTVLTGIPSADDLGEHNILLEATDGYSTVQQQFLLSVSDAASPLVTRTVLRTPAWGAINIPSDTHFSWERLEGATWYHLQVTGKSDVLFENIIRSEESIDATVTGTTLYYHTAVGLPEGTPLIWRVRAENASGFSPWSDVSQYRTAGETTTPNEVADELPVIAELLQNYPNPFNPTTTIAFDLPGATDVTLKIYDLMGREVTTLVSRALPAGRHEVRWDAGDRASGLYLYRLKAGSYVKSKTLSLVK